MALSNSSMVELRDEVEPAAHWSLWEMRNHWLLMRSRTPVRDVAICSDNTCETDKERSCEFASGEGGQWAIML